MSSENNIKIHTVTLKLLDVNSSTGLDYLKNHVSDSNAWQAYFELRQLDHDLLLCETFKLLSKPVLVAIAIAFAESVLDLYESKFQDNRPRLAIDAAKNWLTNPSQENADAAADAARAAYAAYDAYAAANAAYAVAAAAAARAAAYSAANAASAAANAANAARAAANATKNETQKHQLKIVVDVIGKCANSNIFILNHEESKLGV